MRIRYAYKLELEDGSVKFVVLSHIKSEAEVQEQFADQGCTSAIFHERVRTGYRLNEEGDLVPTGLTRKAPEEVATPASAEPTEAIEQPKAKKTKKAKAK